MNVLSVTNGDSYDKVVMMLHGGGGSSKDWREAYESGMFGDTTKIKYVFPDSTLEGGIWYNSYKLDACSSINDACGYDLDSVNT